MKFKRISVLYSALTVGSLIGFAATYVCGTAMCIIPKWINIVISIIPTLVFLGLLIYSLKNDIKKRIVPILSIVMAVVFLILGVINCFAIAMTECTTEITDIKYYDRVLEFYDYPEGYVSVMPLEIPDFAKEVEFYECPMFLQGSSELLLKVKYDIDDFEKAEEVLVNKYGNPIVSKDGSMVETVGDTEYYLSTSFIDYFKLDQDMNNWFYFISANESNVEDKNSPDKWNHAEVSGAAVNYDEQIIVYYARKW